MMSSAASSMTSVVTPSTSQLLMSMIEKSYEKETLDDPVTLGIPTTPSLKGVSIEIDLGKTLNINHNSSPG